MNTLRQGAPRDSAAPTPRARVVIAKPGLDGHDRGAKVIARGLRDAGYEVIYTGLHQTPEQIVATVIAEDAPLLGLSVLSGAHLPLVAKVMDLLIENDADDVRVIVGGIIPAADIRTLKAIGVDDVFTPGEKMQEIIKCVDRLLASPAKPLESAC
ncbi:cobalamin B12-binding domain-containing protein [Streptomyces sp. NPDC053542]|uniref:cobalamin B12-binding domain-containing protein n=1 Tax=Streptomyces sp. NPDC053542 TaxID=3365710 RepID=UPI0037D25392